MRPLILFLLPLTLWSQKEDKLDAYMREALEQERLLRSTELVADSHRLSYEDTTAIADSVLEVEENSGNHSDSP